MKMSSKRMGPVRLLFIFRKWWATLKCVQEQQLGVSMYLALITYVKEEEHIPDRVTATVQLPDAQLPLIVVTTTEISVIAAIFDSGVAAAQNTATERFKETLDCLHPDDVEYSPLEPDATGSHTVAIEVDGGQLRALLMLHGDERCVFSTAMSVGTLLNLLDTRSLA